MSIGSLYEYFDSKDALVQAWCEHHVANARALVDALFDGLAGTPMTDALEPGLAGKYLHNTLGRVTLRHDDTAMNHRAAAALWDTLEQLTA
ncbi:MAG: hypothetical protein Q8S33_08700 [Myxococcales bacterium]|nr:hypothetical protein [Myxococcales bacterium]